MSELKNIVERLTRLLSTMEEQVLSNKELSTLSMRQLNYLDLIRSFKYPKVSDLVESLEVAKPTVTVALNDLIKKGYVIKIRSKHDRRVLNLELTDKGKKINRIHDNAHKRIVNQIFNCLNQKEVDQFQSLVKKILEKSQHDV